MSSLFTTNLEKTLGVTKINHQHVYLKGGYEIICLFSKYVQIFKYFKNIMKISSEYIQNISQMIFVRLF